MNINNKYNSILNLQRDLFLYFLYRASYHFVDHRGRPLHKQDTNEAA